MTFDFFPQEQTREMNRAALMPSLQPEPGMWGNFGPGAFKTAMGGFANVARSIDLLGSVGPIVKDALAGGTTQQDRYFAEHDALFKPVTDYWMPAPGEVGTAGRIVGSLVSGLGTVLISPGLAVGSQILSTGEDLVHQGVSAGKATASGIVQGTGLGLGLWMPVLGNTLGARVGLGAATNVAQGVVTGQATQAILKGEKAAEQFNPWEAEGLVLNTLMGIGFGALGHIGAKAEAARKLREQMTEADRAALLVANQARHLEDTTAPGLPAGDTALTAHAEAMRKAVDDILHGRAPNVAQALQDVPFADDAAKVAAQQEVRKAVGEQARMAILEATALEDARIAAEGTPGFLRTPEQLIALRAAERGGEVAPDLARAIEIANKPAFQRTARERIVLESFLKGKGANFLTEPIVVPEPPAPKETPRPPVAAEPAAGVAPVVTRSPIQAEAEQRLAQRPDLQFIGEDGKPMKLAAMYEAARAEVAQAKQDAGLFETAAACLLGAV